MCAAGVPSEHQVFKEKWRIALDLIDATLPDCQPQVLVDDAGYGTNREFLGELDERSIPFVVQCRSDDTFWDGKMPIEEPGKTKTPKTGRPRTHAHPADKRRKPIPAIADDRALVAIRVGPTLSPRGVAV